MANITKLPLELLQMIASYLHHDDSTSYPDYSTLRSFCASSKSLNAAGTRLLYHRIIMHAVPDVCALIRTLIRRPEIGTHVRHIVLDGDIGVFTHPRYIFGASWWVAKTCLLRLSRSLEKRILPDKGSLKPDQLLAALLVFSPQVRTLSWTRNRRYAAVYALFMYRQYLVNTGPKLLEKLESFTYCNSAATSRTAKPKVTTAEVKCFFLHPRLEHLSVSHIRWNHQFSNISHTRIRTCTFDVSQIGLEPFRDFLQITPDLECLTLTDHFFGGPTETNDFMTLADFGTSLGQVSKLQRLEVRHRAKHPFQALQADRGRIGSLAHLAALEEVIIDPGFLLGDDHSVNEFLSDLLPKSIKRLTFLPRRSAPYAQLLIHLEKLVAHKDFTKLESIEVEGEVFTAQRVDGALQILG